MPNGKTRDEWATNTLQQQSAGQINNDNCTTETTIRRRIRRYPTTHNQIQPLHRKAIRRRQGSLQDIKQCREIVGAANLSSEAKWERYTILWFRMLINSTEESQPARKNRWMYSWPNVQWTRLHDRRQTDWKKDVSWYRLGSTQKIRKTSAEEW